jgi:hypothetical protein
MASRSKAAAADPFADLARKLEILEQEMAVQRRALDRLREMGRTPRDTVSKPSLALVRKTA